MKYYFINYLNLGNSKINIEFFVKKEVILKNKLKKDILPFEKWKYQNVFVNGKKINSISNLWNKDIKEGYIKFNGLKLQIKNFVLIINSKLVDDVNKTQKNWENWWEKIRKKSDVDLYDKLWTEAEQKLNGEPLFVKKDFQNKIVLDAGCGNGRYLPLFESFGAKEIVAVDLGKQIFQVNKQVVAKEKVHLVQADLLNLPFDFEIFDSIASHGVLHHTPNPRLTFYKLSRYLKVGGVFAIYVYHKEWWHFSAHKKSYLLDFLYSGGILIWQSIRKVISRLPHLFIISFCYILALKGTFEQYLMNKRNSFLKTVGSFLFLIPPVCYLGVNFHERVVRNYDHYSATYNYFQTIDEVIDWFYNGGFNNLEVASIPVSIRGVKVVSKKFPVNIKRYKFISHFMFREKWNELYSKLR